MATKNSPFRLVAVLSIVTVINICFFGFSGHWNDPNMACSVDSVVSSVAKYIRHNGKRRLEDTLADTCLKTKPSDRTKETLVSAVKSIVDQCANRNKEQKQKLSSPLITLFTTWPTDPGKEELHNVTLNNWIAFRPKVQIAIFSNDSRVKHIGKSMNIRVFPILKHGGGRAPVLRAMYQTIQQYFNSSLLYGYVNSDILFTDNLIETIEHILHQRSINDPVMMVGKRINVLNVNASEAVTPADVEAIARSRGVLFHANAEDYFFTNKAFPWHKIVDVVVGRVAYDNWIVGHVICKLKIGVIELTESVTAVHQTTAKGGNHEGFQHKDAHYNEAIFKKVGIKPVYEQGFTICAPEYTHIDFCGDIQLSRRTKIWERCACAQSDSNDSGKTGLPGTIANSNQSR